MRVLYVTTIGGTMVFFKKLIQQMINAGYTVDIATNENSSNVPSFFREIGCKVFCISTSRSPLSLGNIKAIKEIKKLAKNYDIVHCHTPLAGMATRIACKKLRKKQGLKVIYTAHGFHFYRGAPKKNWLIYYPIEKICSKWTDILITINKEDYELASRKFKSQDIQYVAGVGIDLEKFYIQNMNRSEKRRNLNVPSNGFIIVSVGELNDNKNQKVIIEALSKIEHSNVYYLIVGEGENRDYLESIACHFGVNVCLLGYRNDVDEIYHCADLCAFTSIREGLGLAAIEGMASGLPLVCSINRGTKEYISEGAIACEYDDVDGFAMAINELINNPEKRISMGIINKSMASKFNVTAINEKMMNIYSMCLDKSRRMHIK